MKAIVKMGFFLGLISVLISCNGSKKNEENFGAIPTESKSINDVVTTVESSEFPLAAQGKALFEGKGTCATCHKTDVKVIGPSLQEIAKIYKEKKGNIVNFLKGESEAIVDPSQYEVMKANFVITKAMSNEDLQSLEQYIKSQGN